MATSIFDPTDRDSGSSSSSSSWQGRLLESSILGVVRITNTNDDDDTTDFFAGGGSNGPIDNTSYQSFCGGGHVEDNDLFCIPCPDNDRQQPLWWLVLRWLKMMLFKVVRTYTGKPILLMMLPLCVGLCIGYFIGCTSHGGDDDSNKAQRRRKTRTQQQSQNPNHWKEQQRECFTATGRPSSIFTTIAIWIWDSILFLVYLRSFIPLKQVNLSADDGQHHSAHDPISISSSTKVATITTENGIVDANHCEKQEEKAAEMRLRLALDGPNLRSREDTVRTNLLRDDCVFESGIVDARRIPKHVAVIMDGNRRYGREVYGNATKGHWDGSSKLVDFSKWCIAERIDVLTVYAFSTENWNRSPDEVAALMSIFSRYCDELRVEALKRNIKILVLSTDVVKVRVLSLFVSPSISLSTGVLDMYIYLRSENTEVSVTPHCSFIFVLPLTA